MIEQNNYIDKNLQTLGNQILASEQMGESSCKPSTSKPITKPLFKPYEFPLEKRKNLNKSKRAELVTKLEIAKMIDQIDKKISRAIIPDTFPPNKSSWIQTLDKVSKTPSDGDDQKIKAIKTIANWRALPRTSFRLGFLDRALTEQSIVVQNSYNANNIYEWNIDGKLEYEIINIL